MVMIVLLCKKQAFVSDFIRTEIFYLSHVLCYQFFFSSCAPAWAVAYFYIALLDKMAIKN